MIKLGRCSGHALFEWCDEETPSSKIEVLHDMLAKLPSHRGCSQGTARAQTGDGQAQGTGELEQQVAPGSWVADHAALL